MIEVREANLDEAEVFLELIDELAVYESLAAPDAEAKKRLVRDGFQTPRKFVPHLALLDGEPVGYAITYFTYSSFLAQPTLFMEDIFVKPVARSQGVGRALFRHLATCALKEGCGRMEWVVLDWNQLAIDFYEKLGATRLAEWQTYRITANSLGKVLKEL